MAVYICLFRLTLLLLLLRSASAWLMTSDPQAQTTETTRLNIITSSYRGYQRVMSTSVSNFLNAPDLTVHRVNESKQATNMTTSTVYTTTVGNTYRMSQENITIGSSSALNQSVYVALTVRNLTSCLNTSHYLKLSTHRAVIDIRAEASDKLPRLSSCEIQVTAPASMVFFINVISINVQCPTFQLVLTDVGATSRRLINSCDTDIPSEVWSFTNIVVMTFLVSLESQAIQVILNFTAIPANDRPKLEIVFSSEKRGYIQTPNWDGIKKYPVLMDSWVKIDVPQLRFVMVSVPHMDVEGEASNICPNDGIEFYVDEILNGPTVTKCKNVPMQPRLFKTHTLYVHFYSNEYGSNTGFRLFFSIHNQSSLPVRLVDGRWNCSGLNWTDFSNHFSCNLRSDCVGSEDEAICTYTSPRCGVGQPFFEKSCYIWEKLLPNVTWKEAFDFCLSRGMRLASLNTPAEWNNAVDLLRLADYSVAFVGMLQMFVQRQMYLNAWQWTDGTIAYFKTIRGYPTMPGCGIFYMVYMMQGINLRDCNEPQIANSHALCETEADPGNELQSENNNPQITVLDISAWQNDSLKVVCPAGHMTHTFLSCDVASACWVRDSLSSCDAPLSILPPAFDCDNGFDQVPHTLVCDHRSDCSDGSDEDFCEFVSCYTSGKYDCGNHQVVTFVISINTQA
ncbi:hypothetical protein C0Q70_10547 [Pomacea canaliculata]|uniref:C-type lectin domain-containing protein n=1 Tax=Pomacea canaliculata TaxID=400727 RepID=A0A2T7P3H9_POMCA|nr:hypothetical protein C0Q70_10547 [Pomacea canaliculata]